MKKIIAIVVLFLGVAFTANAQKVKTVALEQTPGEFTQKKITLSDTEEATKFYDDKIAITKQLMLDKNHDYGEAWRDMRVSSLTDLILQKLLRVKQIEDNAGKTIVSEGIDANYQDMINYAVFAMIHLGED